MKKSNSVKTMARANKIHAARLAAPAPINNDSSVILAKHDNLIRYSGSFQDKQGQFQLFLKVVADNDNAIGTAKTVCLNRLKIDGLFDGTNKGKRAGAAKTTINYSLIVAKAITVQPGIDLLDNWDRTKLEKLYAPKLVVQDAKTGLSGADNTPPPASTKIEGEIEPTNTPLNTGGAAPVNNVSETAPVNNVSETAPSLTVVDTAPIDDVQPIDDEQTTDDHATDMDELFELAISTLSFDEISELSARLIEFVATTNNKKVAQ